MSLELEELQAVADQFGVSEEQVRRDHVISHVLALISRDLADEILFFGGTALARTHLVEGRLSEDLDLIALSPAETWLRRSTPSSLEALPEQPERSTGTHR